MTTTPHLPPNLDNPFWVGPHPEPIISIHPTPPYAITSAPIKIPTTKTRARPRPRPSLDPSPDNPFLNSDNPFIGMDISDPNSSGSGRGSLFKTFQGLSKSQSQGKVQTEKKGKKRAVGEETSQKRKVDVKPSTQQLAAQEGVSNVPGEVDELRLNNGEKRKGSVLEAEEEVEPAQVLPKPKRTRVRGRQTEPLPNVERRMTRARASLAVKVKTEVKDEAEVEEGQSMIAGPSNASMVEREVEVKIEVEDRIDETTSIGAGPSRSEPAGLSTIKPELDIEMKGEIDTASASAGPSTLIDIKPPTQLTEITETKTSGKGKAKGKAKEVIPAGEVRTGRWRKKCPKTTLERLDRVMHQRMFMLDRSNRSGDTLMEVFKVLGSTGNVYTIKINNNPTCDCPDAGKGNIPCKHIIFIFMKVLKVPPSSELWYQKGLLDSELRNIYEHAPSAPVEAHRAREAYMKAINPTAQPEVDEKEDVVGGLKRKEAAGEDCPVCYEEMTDGDIKSGQLVWDESDAGCGKALHVECFRNWTLSLASKGNEITCVWCRCAWPSASAGTTKAGSGGVQYTSTGYMNLADLAGVSRVRDTSTYYHGPIRGRAMNEARYQDD